MRRGGRGRRRTESGYDDDFCAAGDEFAEGFREGQVPADEEADGTERRVDDVVWFVLAGC